MPDMKTNNPFMESGILCASTLIELEATVKRIEAATLRGANQQEIEQLRSLAHDLLDRNMDLKQSACALLRG